MSVALEITFGEQLCLNLVNSLILVFGGGYVVTRSIENRKSLQSVRAKMAETRLPKIATAIAQFEEVREDVAQVSWSLACDAVDRSGLQGRLATVGLSKSDREAVKNTFAAVAVDRADEIAECESRLMSALEALHEEHFWIGADLRATLEREYHEASWGFVDPSRALDELERSRKWLHASKRFSMSRLVTSEILRIRHRRRLKRFGLGRYWKSQADADRIASHLTRN